MSTGLLIRADVLVIGGGMAGCFAAIKARQDVERVVLVDKGYVSKSGQTPYAMDLAVCNPAWGHDSDEWVRELTVAGEYLVDRDWTEAVVADSLARFEDLVAWGAQPRLADDGTPRLFETPGVASVNVRFEERSLSAVLRREARRRGVRIVPGVMVTDLLKTDGRVTGAVGFGVRSGETHVFEAKATVVCAGSYGFKALGFPGNELSADGDALAFRAGAALTGKEFTQIFMGPADQPAAWHAFLNGVSAVAMRHPEGLHGLVDCDGREIELSLPPSLRELDVVACEGRAPMAYVVDDVAADLFREEGLRVEGNRIPITGMPNVGMSVHGSEGIWLDGLDCRSSLPGLYAAGDAAGSRQQGAIYCNWGFAILGAAVTGARAGEGAARCAATASSAGCDEAAVEAFSAGISAPLDRSGGYGPRWVMQTLQATVLPWYVLGVKHGDRLRAALTMVEFIRDHLVPRMYARDVHELRLVHEARNLVLNAEMKLRASLFRTESRGRHLREDYPLRDDPDWLAWTILKKGMGEGMELSKRSIPQVWWPDLVTPYEQRYPVRLPGEEAALGSGLQAASALGGAP